MTPQFEAGGDTGNNEEGGSLIFVSDASAEAERLTTALRGRGYPVIDVPLGLLVSRVSVQRPSLILCDADASGALETIQRVRETPGGNRIDVLFLGEPGRTVDEHAGALQQEASGVFVRPVDDFILLRKVEALIGAPTGQRQFSARTPAASRAPVLVAATRRPYRYDAGKGDAPSSPSAASPAASAPSSALASSTAGSSPISSPTGSAPMSSSPMSAPSSPWTSSEHGFPNTSPGTEPGPVGARRTELPPDSQPHSSRPSSPSPHSVSPRAHELPQARLSPALESLLATAERRVLSVRNSSIPPSDRDRDRLSPEAELEAILPADVLDALDEPLDFDDDDDDADSSIGTHNGDGDQGSRSGTKTTGAGAGTASGGTAGAQVPGTDGGPRILHETLAPPSGGEVPLSNTPESQSSRATEPPATPPRHTSRLQTPVPYRPTFDEPPASVAANSVAQVTAHGPITDLPPSIGPLSDRAAAMSTTPPAARGLADDPSAQARARAEPPEARREPPKLDIPASLGAGDSVRAFARVVRARYTGALAFEDSTGIRRVVFRDGDFVTAASGADGESLVAFLTQRGDLPNDVSARIGRKLPQFGRHAGAALIAQGHLRQDDLWPVLRAHAEWLVARLVSLASGAVGLEADVPIRLQAEPAVFGGATGAEVLVEIVRRAVSPEQAMLRLGGPNAVLQKGENPALLGECAISDA